jgi:20S proteasome alpha/beta subunit
VTLCIAVKCNDVGSERVVCCFDAQVGTEYESTESEYKWRPVSPTIAAMFAGPDVLAKDFIATYSKRLKNAKLRIDNYRDVLWKPMGEFIDAIDNKPHIQDSRIELLVVALVEDSFRIVRVDGNGITDHSGYGAIGTGQDSATSLLRWRKPTQKTDVEAAAYFAYEAKKLGEVSPYVGKVYTHMNLLWPNRKAILRYTFTSQDINELENAFKRFGPQPFDWTWKLSTSRLRDQ